MPLQELQKINFLFFRISSFFFHVCYYGFCKRIIFYNLILFQDVQDPSIFVTFPLEEDENISLVAWTTTPWTLPSNLAVCVNPDLQYVKIKGKCEPGYFLFFFPIFLRPHPWHMEVPRVEV